MKILLIFLTGVLLFGCSSQKSDPFKNLKIGRISLEEFNNDMISQGHFTEPNEDSTKYRYYIPHYDLKIPVEITPNPDMYLFGALRQLKIDLAGDSLFIYDGFRYGRSIGHRLKKEVDLVIDTYKKWYGEPDSIIKHADINHAESDSEFVQAIRRMLGKEASNNDSIEAPISNLIWYRDNFKLSINLSKAEKNPNYNDEHIYRNAEILYEMHNYDNVISSIRDSIRMLQGPNDIISITAQSPKWENLYQRNYLDFDTRFEITLSDLQRKDREDPRAIIGIRFDIIISDLFGNELCRLKDVTYEPRNPIYGLYYSASFRDFFYNTYEVRYFKSGSKSADLERARKYSESNSIRTYTDIKALVFDDEEILSN